MRRMFFAAIPVLTAALSLAPILAQPPAQPQNSDAPAPDASSVRNLQSGPVVLEWTPPALLGLSAQASSKSSFTLDRSMLGAAAALLPDSEAETRQAIGKLDGVSVHLLRFGPARPTTCGDGSTWSRPPEQAGRSIAAPPTSGWSSMEPMCAAPWSLPKHRRASLWSPWPAI